MQKEKERAKEASAEAKRLEKDMKDFKNNKDSKLKEIKADIAKQKSEVHRQNSLVKQQQKNFQTAKLELGMCYSTLRGRT